MSKLVRERDQLCGRGMVSVHADLETFKTFFLAMAGQAAGVPGSIVSSIKPEDADFGAVQLVLDRCQPALGNLPVGWKRKGGLGQGLSLGIEHIINELDGAEVAQHDERTRVGFRPSSEAFPPVPWPRGKAEARLLDIQQHRVERRNVAEPNGEF